MIKPLVRKAAIATGLYRPYSERAFLQARRWSNRELAKLAPHFTGDVVNVSAWEDKDKEGGRYRDYFTSASGYYITNYGTDQGVLQGTDNEVFLDLEQPLPATLDRRFDVVFNHTTLEHIYEYRQAFANMCAMTRDMLLIVVPWLQPHHTDYGDYWRFSAQAMVRLCEENGLTPLRVTWNGQARSSVYIFLAATRHPERWAALAGDPVAASKDADFLRLPQPVPGGAAL